MVTLREFERYMALGLVGSYHSEVHDSLEVRPAVATLAILSGCHHLGVSQERIPETLIPALAGIGDTSP